MGKHTLPDLPYDYDALEPHIDAETMRIHHTKHHQTYVDKLNAALEDEPTLAEKEVEELLEQWEVLPERVQKAVRNHGGGHANHSFFWKLLNGTDGGGDAVGELGSTIETQFGSFKQLKETFKQTALSHFGSGWVWLAVGAGERKVKDQKKLVVLSLPNQDSPLMGGHQPVMGLDLWEHAYYLKYQQDRGAYVDAFWNIIDWRVANENFGGVENVAVPTKTGWVSPMEGRVLER
jgi:superoxide dismutase, Fe-Mn family